MKRRILITGTPGVGKTTVCNLLSKKLNLEYYTLLDFAKKFNTILNYYPEDNEYEIEFEKTSKLIIEWLKKKDNVIIECLYPEILSDEVIDYVFVIRADPKTIEERLKKKGYKKDKIRDNVLAEVGDYCLLRALETFSIEKIHEIYSEGLTPEDIVKEIIDVLNGIKKPKIYDYLPFHKRLYDYF